MIFPVNVWAPAVFMSGLISAALIVTPTHQSEELVFEDHLYDWVMAQFRLTRKNAVILLSEWLWGGMRYQLEHHLFPSMPRAKYPLLREGMMGFAKGKKSSWQLS
jgi:fatty acid desaturase